MDASAEIPLLETQAVHPALSAPSFTVRSVEKHDLDVLVGIHLEQFPEGFYARLGPTFMRAYFSNYFRSPGAVGLIAQQRQDSEVVGYLIGTVDDDVHERFMHRQAALRLTFAGAAALARRPELWANFLRHRSLWYGRRFASGFMRTRHVSASRRQGELLYICTTSGNRRRGIGAALLRSFTETAQRAHTASLHLVSEKGNMPAREFYEHRGWKVISESMTRDQRPLVKMQLSLGGSSE